VDELYDRTIVKPTVDLANGLWRKVDVAVIDALVNGVASATVLWARGMRLVQSGEVQHYALAMALGAVVILGVYLLF
jgi:NADH-quinone oxidoreductase subunit L